MNGNVKSNASVRLPQVRRILLEYDDGSSDIAVLIQDSPLVLYKLTRKLKDEVVVNGAYSGGAVAGIIFKTAVTTNWTNYGATPDQEIVGILKYWFGLREGESK